MNQRFPSEVKNYKTEVKLKIADILICLQSEFELAVLKGEAEKKLHSERYSNFLYSGSEKPHIIVEINIVDCLPEISGAKDIFITYHPDDNKENWRLQKKDDYYIYKCPLEEKKQTILINGTFDKATAYLSPWKADGPTWKYTDIIYDFLQVFLINYLALNNQGIFTHSVGVREKDGGGLLFAGESGAGKSTIARLWHRNSNATVLNDDRIIVRRKDGRFFIYGSPWHGEFGDYLESHFEAATLEKLFFLYHAPENKAESISAKTAFNLLYPALFPTFWNKACLENTVSFCQDLVNDTPCFKLGFLNSARVIEFVRKI